MTQAYSSPDRENDPHALPDIEVFYAEVGELATLRGRGLVYGAVEVHSVTRRASASLMSPLRASMSTKSTKAQRVSVV